MITNIILAGVGGQGILTIAEIIARAALNQGLNIKQSEVHGMAQRGGAVQAHIRIGDEEIFSNVIPKAQAHITISLEPLEALRYLPWLAKDGVIITNNQPVTNISNYPDLDEIFGRIQRIDGAVLVDAKQLAADVGLARAANIALLGRAAAHIPALQTESIQQAIREKFSAKGDAVVEGNLNVFQSAAAS